MLKKFFFAVFLFILVGLVIVGLALVKKNQFETMAEAGAKMVIPPTSVSTYTAKTQSWDLTLNAVGSIEPVQGVLLETEAAGIVEELNFENGQFVEEGTLLVQLDVNVERAQLRAAKATMRLAETEFARSQALRESGNVPQSQLDTKQAELERAQAEIENIEALIDRKTIRAPFSGQLGIRQINLGQFLPLGAPVVALEAHETVFVNFTVPQQSLSEISMGLPVMLKSDAYPEQTFEGAITAISPRVDPQTRTVELQATIPNESSLLRSGLFVRVEVLLGTLDEVLVVPSTAIIYAPYGNSIYVVEEAEDEAGEKTGGLIAKQRFIRTGKTRGDYVSVLEGISEGDDVVAAGAFKLRNGISVSLNNELSPKPELKPTPDNS